MENSTIDCSFIKRFFPFVVLRKLIHNGAWSRLTKIDSDIQMISDQPKSIFLQANKTVYEKPQE